jgi:hypothetical protein
MMLPQSIYTVGSRAPWSYQPYGTRRLVAALRIAENLFAEGDWAILEWRDLSDPEVLL